MGKPQSQAPPLGCLPPGRPGGGGHSHGFDIQEHLARNRITSTRQHGRCDALILIKQSDSPGPHRGSKQELLGVRPRHPRFGDFFTPAFHWAEITSRPTQPRLGPSPTSHHGPTDSALRTNPYLEVTDLTYPHFSNMPEAVHLGDLLRIWVRPGARFLPSPPDFQGPARAHQAPPEPRRFPGLGLALPASPGSFALPHWTPCGAYLRHSGFWDLNQTPFRSAGGDGGHCPTLPNGVSPSLRTNQPMFNCCSHGTLLHFRLQSSRLNICYYHQDLHPRRLHPGSRPGLLRHRGGPPTNRAVMS
ncbi:hypothetical protein NFI96_025093 [Prochilodus magdalenae]|nr:hypothetical protein NFI96_025093 [Prochilodus magdalenae]